MKIYRRDDESEKRDPRDFIFSRGIYKRKDNYILNLNLSFALHIFFHDEKMDFYILMRDFPGGISHPAFLYSYWE